MVIYLRHPKHGTKVAICEAEAVQDEKNGWERYSLLKVDDVKEEEPVPNSLREKRPYRRKEK